jgi:predicted ferric reductase
MSYDTKALELGREPTTQPRRSGETTESGYESAQGDSYPGRIGLRRAARRLIARGVKLIACTILVFIVGVWLHGGGITGVSSAGTLFISIGRLTGLLGAYALLTQLLLLARLPFLQWIGEFDRLVVWHKVNGRIALLLILAHVGFITAGYAWTDRLSIPSEVALMLHSYPGMTAALTGTILLIVVVLTSILAVRRQLGYHIWFLVHLSAYSAVALTWFHQIPTGNVFVTNPLTAAFWTALYVATFQLIILFRFGQPLVRLLWHRLRVAEVWEEAPGVVSLRITGRHLDWLNARAGQFFLWRFLDRERWQETHPFSLSAVPDGKSLRITVKDLGDFSRRIGEIKIGTPVIAEGPFGSFTDDARSRVDAALIAGGVGITPIRALLEEMSGDLTLIYRASREEDLIFRSELEALARERGITIHYVIGSRRKPGNEHLLSASHLRRLIPDIARRDVYLCGPPAMMRAIRTAAKRAGVPSQHIHSDQFAF